MTTLHRVVCRSLTPPRRTARERRVRAQCGTNTVEHCRTYTGRLQRNIVGWRLAAEDLDNSLAMMKSKLVCCQSKTVKFLILIRIVGQNHCFKLTFIRRYLAKVLRTKSTVVRIDLTRHLYFYYHSVKTFRVTEESRNY